MNKKNPANLNALQARTLALFQELARHPENSDRIEATGEVELSHLPHPHGDHLHVGSYVVSARDASGFNNEAVWVALERKGLARSEFPYRIILTSLGLNYDTGYGDTVMQHSDH